jgi:hypothetical protein
MFPLVKEDLCPGSIAGDHSEVGAQGFAEALRWRSLGKGNGFQGRIELISSFKDDAPEELLFALNVVVEASSLQVDGLGKLPHRGSVVTALAEEEGSLKEDVLKSCHSAP